MAAWALTLPFDDNDRRPVFIQIAQAICEAIQRGRLAPAERLPGTRTLAHSLGVHRNTVVAAYDELLAEGWVETSQTRGTFVAATLPMPKRAPAKREGLSRRAGFDLPDALPLPAIDQPPKTSMIVLAGGAPDLSLVPKQALARAYRRALLGRSHHGLDYGDPQGDVELRAQLARLLAEERGVVARPEEILVVRGSQMAMRLIGEVLFESGDRIAVEDLGYPPAWVALRSRATLLPVPVDEHGLDVGALAELTKRRKIRGVYVTPHHQHPTMVVLSASRRLELLELARTERFAIIEDDYDNEVHYRGRPVLPLASVDRHGVVIYVGTLSKVLAPGLRLGYVVAPEPVIQRLTDHRRYVDRQGDLTLERAVAELMEDGEVQRHARRMRRVYSERRAAMVDALERHLGDVLEVRSTDGGMALWAEAHGVDVDRWAANARTKGVWFATARPYAFDGRKRPFVRLGFAAVPEKRLAVAVRRMREALA